MNKIIIVLKDGTETIVEKAPDGLSVEWKGDNSYIKIHESTKFTNSVFKLCDNCHIEIGENSRIMGLFIYFSTGNSFVKIGKNFIPHKSSFILAGNNQSITIGDYCLFAVDVDIYTSDGHTIYNLKNKKVLNNKGGNIVIGNHCWLGKGSMVTKMGTIANDVVVGAHSLVNKKYDKSNVILAGSPAKIIKKNVNWDIKHPDFFEKGVI